MDSSIVEAPPTSTAATQETEPEVVAGISSAEGSPDMPLAIRSDEGNSRWLRLAGLTAAGVGLGYLAGRWMRR